MNSIDPNATDSRGRLLTDRVQDYRDYRCTTNDPYGFVTVKPVQGATPDFLSGQYTSYDEARKAIDVYIQQPSVQEKFSQVKPPTPIVKPPQKVKHIQ